MAARRIDLKSDPLVIETKSGIPRPDLAAAIVQYLVEVVLVHRLTLVVDVAPLVGKYRLSLP